MTFAPLRSFWLVVLATWLGGCGGVSNARLSYHALESGAMHGMRMPYSVYAPPDHSATERLPLVVFLHGGGDDHKAFDRWGMGERLDDAIDQGRVPRVVIVVPEGHVGFWANWVDRSRNYESWVLDEVVPQVSREYHTQPCPEGCHLMGVSMGGAGTIRMGILHPGRFASLGVLSAPVMDTNQVLEFANNRLFSIFIPTHRIWGEPTRSLVEQEDPFLVWTDRASTPRMFVAWAKQDREAIRMGSKRLARHLQSNELPHESLEFSGGHNWVSWRPVIERALRFAVEE